MAMRYGYFDSEITGVDENGMPIFDRAETSDLFRMLFANLVSNGVLATPGDCFQVVAGAGMTVRIRPGFAMMLTKLQSHWPRQMRTFRASTVWCSVVIITTDAVRSS